jgi:hypothetical protein
MAKKSEIKLNPRAMNTKLRINEEVFCACNNLKCSGTCRSSHLTKKNGFGYCSAAFNKNNNKDKRIRTTRSKTEDAYENWQDWV